MPKEGNSKGAKVDDEKDALADGNAPAIEAKLNAFSNATGIGGCDDSEADSDLLDC